MLNNGDHASSSVGDVDARIVYQPLIDLASWTVVGFEALARFADGVPAPAKLDAAEAAGVRTPLELALIAQSVDSAHALPSGLFVTLNASGSTMLDPRLPPVLAASSRPWGLELYEGATPADLQAIRHQVSTMGGQLLVDDAGAACADEERITRLRPDVVKIDRQLFWQISTDAVARARLEPLITAARATNARVLVEGVSEPEHVELARSIGADLAQGFHLGMPTAAEDMADALRALHGSVGVDTPGL